jgi:hypothetical protein
LASHWAAYDNIPANIIYSRLDCRGRGRGRGRLAAELPLFYTAGRWPTPSEVNYLYLPSIRLLKAKQELVGVTADRRLEHIFGVIIVLVCKN